jgi:hypothetical protein
MKEMNRRRRPLVALAVLPVLALAGCGETDADVVSKNLSTKAEQFEVNRRIVFFNGITDKYLFTVEGRCSVESAASHVAGSLEVTCKTGPEENEQGYKKHFLGLSDNVSYFIEQLEPAKVDEFHYKVIFKPETLVPSIDLETSGERSQ